MHRSRAAVASVLADGFLAHRGKRNFLNIAGEDDRAAEMRFSSARDVDESVRSSDKNVDGVFVSVAMGPVKESRRHNGDADDDAWEIVGKKKSSTNAHRSSVDGSVSSQDGKKRRNGVTGTVRNGSVKSEKSHSGRRASPSRERGDAGNAVGKDDTESGRDQQHRQQQQHQHQNARSESAGWAAVVTGRVSPSEVATRTAAHDSLTEKTLVDSIQHMHLSPGSDGAESSHAKPPIDDSLDADGSQSPQSPQSDRESQLISGARENAAVVGAGAKALRGWASILGGTSASKFEEDRLSPSSTGPEESVEASSPEATSQASEKRASTTSTWTGWGVSAPPPKVDLKATMEADAAAAAAAPQRAPPSVKREAVRMNDKPLKQNGRNKKVDIGAKKDSFTKQKQDTNRKERAKPSRVVVNICKSMDREPIDVSATRSRAPISSDVENVLAARLGRELLDCAHMQYFTPTAHLLKKERRAVDVVIRAMNAIVQTLFPTTDVEVFGSFPTRAWVPGSSNVDLSLELPDAISSRPDRRLEALNTLAMALRTNPWVMDVSVVPSSSRPLIRMTTHTAFFQPMPQQLTGKAAMTFAQAVNAIVPPLVPSATESGTPPLPPGPRPGAPPYSSIPSLGQNGFGLPLEVHISLKDSNHRGQSSLRFIQMAEEQHGALAPICCVQKAVLASKGMRGVYKGGLGSYALTLMALTSIQRSSGRRTDDATSVAQVVTDEGNKQTAIEDADSRDALYVGHAMLDFLKLYGFEADLTKDIIAAHGGDDSANWGILGESQRLASAHGSGLRVEDPLDASNNAGAGCFGISGVQALFKEQLEVLRKAAESNFESNIPLLMQLVMLGGSQKVFIV